MQKSLFLMPLLLSACATTTHPAAGRYEGFYTWGFEVSGFQPCGSTESWWVTGGDLQSRYDEVATRAYEPVYVEVTAEVGPEGKFGHLGASSREVEVKEVLEMRAARATDCR